jgi:hypothetical protein
MRQQDTGFVVSNILPHPQKAIDTVHEPRLSPLTTLTFLFLLTKSNLRTGLFPDAGAKHDIQGTLNAIGLSYSRIAPRLERVT